MVDLLVGIKTRKGRNEPQRAMGGQEEAQHNPLPASVHSQTQRQPLIPIQLVRYSQISLPRGHQAKGIFSAGSRSTGLKRKLQLFSKANRAVLFPFLLPRLHQSEHHPGG